MTATKPRKAAAKSTKASRSEPVAEPTGEGALSEEELAALAEETAPADLPDGEIRPVIIGKRGRRGDAPVQMVTLFELDDVPHQIPRNPSAALVLRWMLDVEEHGVSGAAMRMAVTLLGKDALDKLAASPEVEVEDLGDVFTNIGTVFFTSDNYRKIQAASDPS